VRYRPIPFESGSPILYCFATDIPFRRWQLPVRCLSFLVRPLSRAYRCKYVASPLHDFLRITLLDSRATPYKWWPKEETFA